VKVCSIGSGSKGNGTLIQSESGCLLVDCGFGLKDCLERMQTKGVLLEDLKAILVTHEHGDHGKGVGMLARKAGVPVYGSAGTRQALSERGIIDEKVDFITLAPEKPFELIGLNVTPVPVPHDARETFQFLFSNETSCFGLLTDVGSITPHLLECYRACEYLLLEFNHDFDMLWQGPYPESLKQRVSGPLGHLSNEQSSAFLEGLNTELIKKLVVSHMSEQNNTLEHVQEILNTQFSSLNENVLFASQSQGTDWFSCI
jgi:phosphoribosyl 1,2-cyclic phosphodiesterase